MAITNVSYFTKYKQKKEKKGLLFLMRSPQVPKYFSEPEKLPDFTALSSELPEQFPSTYLALNKNNQY